MMTLQDFSTIGKKVLISTLVFLIPVTILTGGILLVEHLLN
ncbi:hypothetical protein VB264_14785 [Arcicella aquatica]|uniref:Uncharacterized protein n=1 Tax=Arcicella aquatica TaxID=217141 RepID=A0ABU5QQM0_9BACT|nr:hypothetical protein [Arcicella aquatica]MEA5259060.1 hypothetical protein [Arcicella aquatica]